MKKAYITMLICCVLTVCPTFGARAQDSAAGKSTVRGTTEPVTGSPVALSDARYVLTRSVTTPGRLEVVGNGIKVENVSGREIKRLFLSFDYHNSGSASRVSTAVDALAAGETRDYMADNTRIVLTPNSNGITLNVMPTGAEFKDGSHWAASRTKSSPLGKQCLYQAGSRLMIRQCQLSDGSYSVSLQVTDPGITAYRLGTIKDTPDHFEVRLGKWVDLSGVEPDQSGRFVDSGQSLGADQMFPADADAKAGGVGKAMTVQPGVAIFVAALRFADGRVWSQDTSRQELLWDN